MSEPPEQQPVTQTGPLKKVLPKDQLLRNPRKKIRINLTGRYLPCPASGYREAGACHGLTFLPVKRGKNSFFTYCGLCRTKVELTDAFDPTRHGLTIEQAHQIASQAIADGESALIT
jgi:hypothetical protein